MIVTDQHYVTVRGSTSFFDTATATVGPSLACRRDMYDCRNPLSVLLCSHRMTATPLAVAASTSWWPISPVGGGASCCTACDWFRETNLLGRH